MHEEMPEKGELKMVITEYNDCLSLRYSDIPEGAIDRETHEASVEMALLNGKKVEIDLVIKRKKDGTHKVVELLLPKNLSEEEIDDIADIHWYVFPKKERGQKLFPIIDCWEKDETVLTACLSPKYGLTKRTFAEQWAPLENENVSHDPARLLCWWPDSRAWEAMKEINSGPLKEHVFPFYTFSEWFKRPDTGNVSYTERGTEYYARYLRRLRTILLFCRQKGIKAKLTVGNIESAYRYFKEKRLDPNEQPSWAFVATQFDEMPDVLVEKKLPCGPVGILDPKQGTVATVSYYSHMPEFPSIDCVGASLYSGNTPLCDLLAWPNPLAGEKVYKETAEALFDTFREYAVKKVYTVDGVLPFEACPECGNMSIRFGQLP